MPDTNTPNLSTNTLSAQNSLRFRLEPLVTVNFFKSTITPTLLCTLRSSSIYTSGKVVYLFICKKLSILCCLQQDTRHCSHSERQTAYAPDEAASVAVVGDSFFSLFELPYHAAFAKSGIRQNLIGMKTMCRIRLHTSCTRNNARKDYRRQHTIKLGSQVI